MSKVYKLQRYTSNGTWEDVTLGVETSSAVQTYLTEEAAKELFLAKDVIQTGTDEPSLQFSDLGAAAVGKGAVAFGQNAVAIGDNTFTVGSGTQITINPGFSLVENSSNQLYATNVQGLSTGRLMQATTTQQNYFLTITNISHDATTNKYIVTVDDLNGFLQGRTLFDGVAWSLPNYYIKGNNSAAIGYNLIATGSNQLVCGQFNQADPNALLIVGDGIAAQRSNALEVFSDNVQFNVPVTLNQQQRYGGVLDSMSRSWTPGNHTSSEGQWNLVGTLPEHAVYIVCYSHSAGGGSVNDSVTGAALMYIYTKARQPSFHLTIHTRDDKIKEIRGFKPETDNYWYLSKRTNDGEWTALTSGSLEFIRLL